MERGYRDWHRDVCWLVGEDHRFAEKSFRVRSHIIKCLARVGSSTREQDPAYVCGIRVSGIRRMCVGSE